MVVIIIEIPIKTHEYLIYTPEYFQSSEVAGDSNIIIEYEKMTTTTPIQSNNSNIDASPPPHQTYQYFNFLFQQLNKRVNEYHWNEYFNIGMKSNQEEKEITTNQQQQQPTIIPPPATITPPPPPPPPTISSPPITIKITLNANPKSSKSLLNTTLADMLIKKNVKITDIEQLIKCLLPQIQIQQRFKLENIEFRPEYIYHIDGKFLWIDYKGLLPSDSLTSVIKPIKNKKRLSEFVKEIFPMYKDYPGTKLFRFLTFPYNNENNNELWI